MPGIKVYGGGVTAENGNYAARVDLDKLHGAILEALAQPSQAEVDFVALQTAGRAAKTYGPPSFVDPAVLSDAHWGIIWPEKPWTANEQAHYAALQELVAWRAAKNGVVPLEKEYRDRWNYAQFLQYAGPNVLPGQMDTEKIPYYLCIVASPERISWEFQQFLDGEYAVGRLWFDDPRDCVSYVRKLIAYEDEGPGQRSTSLAGGSPTCT
jgi:hypothetical protein